MRLTGLGIAVGLVAAFFLTRLIVTVLKATDPATMVVLILLIAAVASWVPAWRAANLDPNAVLRERLHQPN